eukprot:TRINITY_DN60914_c2_g1_i1.p1 TRINITY_DN60914_c2_g1~~TRINITY_DN60914_c2_g1_i1.p1  ORF type:complete len:311 (+),score=42.81 TRINITY_DN60914_c2_g1_i1:115-933(+)
MEASSAVSAAAAASSTSQPTATPPTHFLPHPIKLPQHLPTLDATEPSPHIAQRVKQPHETQPQQNQHTPSSVPKRRKKIEKENKRENKESNPPACCLQVISTSSKPLVPCASIGSVEGSSPVPKWTKSDMEASSAVSAAAAASSTSQPTATPPTHFLPHPIKLPQHLPTLDATEPSPHIAQRVKQPHETQPQQNQHTPSSVPKRRKKIEKENKRENKESNPPACCLQVISRTEEWRARRRECTPSPPMPWSMVQAFQRSNPIASSKRNHRGK